MKTKAQQLIVGVRHRLMLAAFSGQLSSVKELCHYGADRLLVDNYGATAFHWTMDSGHCPLVTWFLEHGADVSATDFNGWTPLLRLCEFASQCSRWLKFRSKIQSLFLVR